MDTKDARITLRLPTTLFEKLKKLADLQGISTSAYIRTILEKHYSKRTTPAHYQP